MGRDYLAIRGLGPDSTPTPSCLSRGLTESSSERDMERCQNHPICPEPNLSHFQALAGMSPFFQVQTGCVQGRVSDVGSNTASSWKGHPAPRLVVSSLCGTLLAMSVVHVGQPHPRFLGPEGHRLGDQTRLDSFPNLATLQTLRPSLGK